MKNILIVNHKADENQAISKNLENLNYKINLNEIALNTIPDLIIIDSDDERGFELLEKNFSQEIKNIPQIILISNPEKKKVIYRYDIVEYLMRPINKNELIYRVNQLLWIKELENELKLKSEELEKNKLTDSITNLYNSIYLLERFEEELTRSNRYNYSISYIMIDVNNFNRLEDVYSKEAFSILKEVGYLLKKSIRVVDIISHYKKGCFVIILPQTSIKGAHILAERIRYEIENHSFIIKDNILKIKANVAIVEEKNTEKEKIIEKLFNTIDKIKKEGGNLVKEG